MQPRTIKIISLQSLNHGEKGFLEEKNYFEGNFKVYYVKCKHIFIFLSRYTYVCTSEITCSLTVNNNNNK